jgi:hypothetical protein
MRGALQQTEAENDAGWCLVFWQEPDLLVQRD